MNLARVFFSIYFHSAAVFLRWVWGCVDGVFVF